MALHKMIRLYDRLDRRRRPISTSWATNSDIPNGSTSRAKATAGATLTRAGSGRLAENGFLRYSLPGRIRPGHARAGQTLRHIARRLSLLPANGRPQPDDRLFARAARLRLQLASRSIDPRLPLPSARSRTLRVDPLDRRTPFRRHANAPASAANTSLRPQTTATARPRPRSASTTPRARRRCICADNEYVPLFRTYSIWQ